MTENKKYDLEERTFNFARNVRKFVQLLPHSIILRDDIGQVIRSSGSIGANYIEANESLSKKDFVMRVKISRKEAKETIYWLKLLSGETLSHEVEEQRNTLEHEVTELMHIFGSIISKVS